MCMKVMPVCNSVPLGTCSLHRRGPGCSWVWQQWGPGHLGCPQTLCVASWCPPGCILAVNTNHHQCVRHIQSDTSHHKCVIYIQSDIIYIQSDTNHHKCVRHIQSDTNHHKCVRHIQSDTNHKCVRHIQSDTNHHKCIRHIQSDTNHHKCVTHIQSDTNHHKCVTHIQSDTNHHKCVRHIQSDTNHHKCVRHIQSHTNHYKHVIHAVCTHLLDTDHHKFVRYILSDTKPNKCVRSAHICQTQTTKVSSSNTNQYSCIRDTMHIPVRRISNGCAFLPIPDLFVASRSETQHPTAPPLLPTPLLCIPLDPLLVQCVVCSETVVFLCFSRTCSPLVWVLPSVNVCAPVSLFNGGCSHVDKSGFHVAILLLWPLEDHEVLWFFFWNSLQLVFTGLWEVCNCCLCCFVWSCYRCVLTKCVIATTSWQ